MNPFDAESLDPLLATGLALQERGDHEQAIDFLREAWQANRISHGLYDVSNLPVLDALIDSQMRTRDWDTVNSYYAYMEQIYRRSYGLDDSRLEAGLQKISGWLSNAMLFNMNGKRLHWLGEANRIFKLRLQVAELTLADDHPKLAYLKENIVNCEKQLYQVPQLDNHTRAENSFSRERRQRTLARR